MSLLLVSKRIKIQEYSEKHPNLISFSMENYSEGRNHSPVNRHEVIDLPEHPFLAMNLMPEPAVHLIVPINAYDDAGKVIPASIVIPVLLVLSLHILRLYTSEDVSNIEKISPILKTAMISDVETLGLHCPYFI